MSDSVAPLAPQRALCAASPAVLLISIVAAQLLRKLRGAAPAIRFYLGTLRPQQLRLVGKAVATGSGLLCALVAAGVALARFAGLRQDAPASWLLRVSRPGLHRCLVRPALRITSYIVHQGAASLPDGRGLLVDGGANDGFIDIASQNAINAPIVHRTSGSLEQKTKSMKKHGSMLSAGVASLKPLSRAYSDIKVSADCETAARQLQPLEAGKWRIIRVSGGDHSLGTALHPQSLPVYEEVFRLLAQQP